MLFPIAIAIRAAGPGYKKTLGMVGVFVILAVFSQDLEVKGFKNAGTVLTLNTKPPAP